MAKLTKANLTKVANEFNKVMALDPPINVKKAVPQLESDIKEAAEELRDDDEFSPEVEGFLIELGIREPEPEADQVGEEVAEETPTVDDNEEDIETAEAAEN